MFATKVTVSEETMKKNNLTQLNRGRLRYEKLQELERTGEISKASTRNELMQMVGYERGSASGNSWVVRMIRMGYLTETFVGFEGEKARKEFHLTTKRPDFEHKGVAAAHRGRKRATVKTTPKAEPKPMQMPAPKVEEKEPTQVKIEYGEMVITIENASSAYVSEIIKAIKGA